METTRHLFASFEVFSGLINAFPSIFNPIVHGLQSVYTLIVGSLKHIFTLYPGLISGAFFMSLVYSCFTLLTGIKKVHVK